MSNQPSSQEQARRGDGQRPDITNHKDQQINSPVSTQKSISNVEADLDNPSPKDLRENCFICAEPIIYYAVSSCNHRTCHICSLRLRALYKTKNCVYCKTEQVKVIFTRDPEKPFQDYKDTDIPYCDKKLNVFCEDQEIYEDMCILLSYNCPEKKCTTPYSGWHELKKHVRRDHRMWLCDVCIRNKKVFVHEHTLFTERERDEHYEKGDESGFKGHPECEFCELPFYGEDELYTHCRRSHQQCPICEADGIRHQYYLDYSRLFQHFKKDHYLCLYRECLEKKFIVFKTDIDLRAHEVEVHRSNERRIETNFSYVDAHTRSRSHQRSPERQDGGGGEGVNLSMEEIGRQIRNVVMGESSTTNNRNGVNARIRPPGFGALSPDEVTKSSNSSPQSTDVSPLIREQSSRVRAEEFPTLRASMRAVGNNNERAGSGRLSTPIRPSTSQQSLPKDANKQRKDHVQQSIVEASSSNTSSRWRSPARNEAFPALTAPGNLGNPGNTLNYSQKIKANIADSNSKSRHLERISSYLSNNKSKIDEYHLLFASYKEEKIDASKYIESLSLLLGKNLGKVISGLVEWLDDEIKGRELLRIWNDHRAVEAFPALESPDITSSVHNPPVQNKANPRVLVIKSSNTRAGGARPSSAHVHDRVAAAALKSSTKTNSNSPALPANVWKGSPQFVKSTPQASSSSVGDSSSYMSTTTTGFIKGRPTKLENSEDFPGLPSASSSKRVDNNKSAWGHGGAFSSLTPSHHKEPETDSDNDLYVDVDNDGKKKKQQKKKQKQVLFRSGSIL